MITPEDHRQAQKIDRLLRKLERDYYKDLLSEKDQIVDQASYNYEQRGVLLNELEIAEFTNKSAIVSRKFADKAIFEFTIQTRNFLQEPPPRPSFVAYTKDRYFQGFGLSKSKLAAETTIKDIKRIVGVGISEGKGSKQIAREILKVKPMNRWRAEAVARTEIGAAQSFSQRASIEQIEQTTDKKIYKKWISTPDNRRRPSHEAMEGKEVLSTEYFKVGDSLLYLPRDPNGAPKEIINCRCTASLRFSRK